MSIFLFSLLWIMYHNWIIRRRNEEKIWNILIISMISFIGFYVIYYYFNMLILSILLISFFYICYTDIKYYLIYNSVNICVFLINFMNVILCKDFKNYIFNIIIFSVVFIVTTIIMKLSKKDFIGGGDLKLIIAMVGLVRGIEIFYVLFISSFSCLVIYIFIISKIRENKEIFFGPFLCIGYFVYLLLFK